MISSPITGRVHQPPPVHQTFQAEGFVVCSFVPRLFDYHPRGIPAPYDHPNVNSDEVIYHCDGNLMSRKGIAAGSLELEKPEHQISWPEGRRLSAYERVVRHLASGALPGAGWRAA